MTARPCSWAAALSLSCLRGYPEILQAKVFQSTLCDYLLRPFPWLRRAIETSAVKHGLQISQTCGAVPNGKATEPEPEILDVSPRFQGNYKSCLDRPHVQLGCVKRRAT